LTGPCLRHQVTVLQRKTPKPKLRPADRRLWVWLSRSWSRWRSALVIVKPATVVDWHRRGFRWYWTWKVRHGKAGRPSVTKATRELIRTMSRDNVLGGARESTANFSSSGFQSLKPRWPNTGCDIRNRRRKRGERFWQITCRKWFRSTSSPYTPSGSRLCLYLSYSRTTADASCIST